MLTRLREAGDVSRRELAKARKKAEAEGRPGRKVEELGGKNRRVRQGQVSVLHTRDEKTATWHHKGHHAQLTSELAA